MLRLPLPESRVCRTIGKTTIAKNAAAATSGNTGSGRMQRLRTQAYAASGMIA